MDFPIFSYEIPAIQINNPFFYSKHLKNHHPFRLRRQGQNSKTADLREGKLRWTAHSLLTDPFLDGGSFPGCAKKRCESPSGKHTKNYRKSPFLMGKSTIHGPFSIAMFVYQRVQRCNLMCLYDLMQSSRTEAQKKTWYFSASWW